MKSHACSAMGLDLPVNDRRPERGSASDGVRIGLRDIQLIAAVIRLGTLTGAANFLGMSEPGASKAIGMIEERWGVKLFDRARTGMRPRRDAERVLRGVGVVYRDVEALRAVVVGRKRGVQRVAWR